MKRLLLILWWCPLLVSAQTASQQVLPNTVTEIFAKANVPLSHVGVLVEEVDAAIPLVAHNVDAAFNPASVMKLVTTYAGLDLLGPAYTWKTEVHAVGEIRNGTLYGDLAIKGYGDPRLTIQRFTALLQELRDRGLKKITGDLLLDRSYFESMAHDPALFDGEPLKAYNVGADALLMNFKTVGFMFAPAFDGKRVVISPDAKPAQLEIVNRVKLGTDSCGDWQERIKLDQVVSPINVKVIFSGSYAEACGTRMWNIALLDHPRFVGGTFSSLWKRLGGSWDGVVKLGNVPTPASLLAFSESSSLAEMVRDINKYSNNVMARQLFLTLSAEINKQAGATAQSEMIVKDWLAHKGIAANELTIENGAGLSRTDRISTQTLGSLLQAAWKSSVMPEFMSSLPLLGLDGTMRNRGGGKRNEPIAGKAHIKSGTLNEVRAIAGYVLDANGKRWMVVMLINDRNAAAAQVAQAAQDALLQWVYQH